MLESLIKILDAVAGAIDTQLHTFTGVSLRAFGKVGVRITEVLASVLLAILIGYVGQSVIQSVIAQIRSIDFGALKAHPVLLHYLLGGVLTPVVAVVGAGLSSWKSSRQLSYGVVETLFGMAFSFAILAHLSPNSEFSKWFALGSAIYVISRGIENASKAAQNAPSQDAPPPTVDPLKPKTSGKKTITLGW